ncbi:MAG: sulfite exporter TauE/SafE family protein [Candidatus Omnitrophica bacterium]|nr:sulfite exporter TauE/SafE family protein [Candidatus Omnitrophota bacterium]
MNMLQFDLAIGAVSVGAGLLGSLTGLGGGVVIVPVLAILFGVDVRYAIGASLVSVIATSSGAASAYVKEGYTNLRIGMFLEIATTFGALFGAFIAAKISTSAVTVIFGLVLVYSAYLSGRPHREQLGVDRAERLAEWLELDSSYPSRQGPHPYHVHAVPYGFSMMFVAGTLSGLLGIGSGAAKVVAMDDVMRVPFKVSTTTSNFMIGVTAAASAGVYLNRGYIDPALAMPVMLGVLAGSLLGARLLMRIRSVVLRRIFALVIFVLAAEMLYNGFTGRI